MSRSGENIYKRKDGRWEARYIRSRTVKGKPKYGYVYAHTYADVKKKLQLAQSSIFVEPFKQKSNEIPFETIARWWLGNIRMKVKESTFTRYQRNVEKYLLPRLGDLMSDRISRNYVEKVINELLDEGRLDGAGGLSVKTASDILTVLKSIIKYSQTTNYPINCCTDNISLKREKKELRILTQHEQETISKYLLEGTDSIKLGVFLCLYTGIRIGELCALLWENILIDDKVLKIRSTMQRIKDSSPDAKSKTKIVITSPKSNSSNRDIPLPEFLVSIIKNYVGLPKAYVLTGEKRSYIEPRTVQNRFKAYLRDCKISDINFHALRSTFATRCVEAGFEIKTLSEILGHSEVKITLERYVHASFDLKRSNMNKLTLGFS